MFDKIRRFIHGINKFSPDDFRHLKFPEIIKFIPSETPFSNLLLWEEALKILWNKKATYSIEIWKVEDFEFYISSNRFERLRELAYRLSAVYPSSKLEFSKKVFPEAKGYVASGFLKLKGSFLGLKTLEDFDYDSLVHVISAIRNPCIIQFLFKPEKLVIETFSGDYPIYRLRIAVSTIAEKWKEARDECERILRSFSVFNGFAKLKPVLSSPVRSSRSIFERIVKRQLSFFEGFKITSQALATIAHFPIRGIEQ